MFSTTRICLARAHQPLIKFVGPRHWPAGTETPHFHPAAPVDLRDVSEGIAKSSSLSSSSSSSAAAAAASPAKDSSSTNKTTYGDFWEAPERLWKPRIRYIQDFEIDAVHSGGASLRR